MNKKYIVTNIDPIIKNEDVIITLTDLEKVNKKNMRIYSKDNNENNINIKKNLRKGFQINKGDILPNKKYFKHNNISDTLIEENNDLLKVNSRLPNPLKTSIALDINSKLDVNLTDFMINKIEKISNNISNSLIDLPIIRIKVSLEEFKMKKIRVGDRLLLDINQYSIAE
tara:strand:- start:431 stop:940 length:510 start_codon:yes stop_codon:yes gene_type:complete